MKKAIITDYNIIEADMNKQKVLENNQVRFDFDDCYFIIDQNRFSESGLQINKIGKKITNSDQISIEPNSTNSIAIF